MNIDVSSISLKDLIRDETGGRFKDNKCRCPFHHEKTASLSVMSNDRFYKCFGCGKSGDAISFIQDYKHLSFIDAVKYLKLDNQLTDRYKSRIINRDKVAEKVKQVYKKENLVLKDLYEYTNEFSEVLYYRAKLKDEDNKSHARCISIVNDKVEFTRGEIKEVPYRLDAVQRALMRDKKTAIFITEGEKDADTLANIFHKCSTSLKSVDLESYDFSFLKDVDVYFVGDTGKAGEQYRAKVWKALREYVSSFNVVELEGIEALGDNKDVTDWLETFSDVNDACREFKRACDPLLIWDWKISTRWRDVLVNKKGDVIPNPKSINNVVKFLNDDGVKVQYNEVTGNLINTGSKRYIVSTDGVCEFDIGRIIGDMWQAGCKVDKDTIMYSVSSIKKKYRRNPFQEMILKNSNNNYHLIDELVDLLNLKTDFEKILFKKFLFCYVRQGFNSEVNRFVADGVLVIRGEQGIGKSRFSQELGLCSNQYFHLVKSLDLDNEQSMRKATKANLTELQEMVIYGKKDVEKLKAFLTTPEDEYRPLYSNTIEHRPRFTAFICTTNDNEFLNDPTGSRRFWVIEPQVNQDKEYGGDALGRILCPSNVGLNVMEVLGAVYHKWINTDEEDRGLLCSLNRDELEKNNLRNSAYYSAGNVGKIISDVFDMSTPIDNFMKKSDLFKLLGLFGITKLSHAHSVEKFLSNRGVKTRGADGQTPKSKCGNHRGYTLWSLAKEYSNFNRE